MSKGEPGLESPLDSRYGAGGFAKRIEAHELTLVRQSLFDWPVAASLAKRSEEMLAKIQAAGSEAPSSSGEAATGRGDVISAADEMVYADRCPRRCPVMFRPKPHALSRFRRSCPTYDLADAGYPLPKCRNTRRLMVLAGEAFAQDNILAAKNFAFAASVEYGKARRGHTGKWAERL